ncbi:MAG: carboxymuconolactone decarboxylase family protein [Chitinophagales bacterium]|nr:carboxymuconolactone decarboxylase family protein [Hyphomicrobiales bacterium]
MARINTVDHASATGERKDLMDGVKAQFGAVIKMFGTAANSAPALKFMLAGFGALGQGRLGAALGEQIAIAMANRNACEYCLSAHSALGKRAGLSADALSAAREGRSDDRRAAAAITFALALVEGRGHVSDAQFAAVRAAGFDDEEIVEIIAHVALNIFTNYLNVALDVPVDFPSVKPLSRAA